MSKYEVGGIYRLQSRNLDYGVWDGEAFIGIRTKLGHRFLAAEFPWEDGPPFGTAKAGDLIGRVPDGMDLRECLETRCKSCGLAADFDLRWRCAGGCHDTRAYSPSNEALFEFLDGIDA